MPVSRFEWLVFPPAVDLVNSRLNSPDGELDLLEDEAGLETWIAAESGRLPHAEAANGKRAELTELRTLIRRVLDRAVDGGAQETADVEELNRLSALAPEYAELDESLRLKAAHTGRGDFDALRAHIARSAMELIAEDANSGLAACGAPSCGGFFIRTHPKQVWCTPACGNRARVARHARRHQSRKETRVASSH